MKLLGFGICFSCAIFLAASETYRAAVVNLDKERLMVQRQGKDFASLVYEAGKKKADILVLHTPEPAAILDNYDEIDEVVKSLSKAADEANLYVVAHLYEKTKCQNNVEVVRSNLVFNREGAVVSTYRKPVSNLANCTSTPSELVTFTTDFGVTFGLLLDEDILLHGVEYMKGLKNFVMTGRDLTFLNAGLFTSSWTFVNNVNLVSNFGIFGGKTSSQTTFENLLIADLNKNGVTEGSTVLTSKASDKYSSEDLSQYITKSLDLEASAQGYRDIVCHRSFCCEFYIKTGVTDSKSDVSYNLAVFDGVLPFTAQHNIGVQNCVVVTKKSSNNTNIHFEKISVTANFTKPNAQYPVVHTTSVLPIENFKFGTKTNGFSTQVTVEVVDGRNILKFGIFGRDFAKDYESYTVQRDNSESTYDIYDLIFNEDVQEFFDYLWIRLRILIVVVSIYVLEML